MLEHLFLVLEFKPEFEFCLNLFFKETFSFSSPPFPYCCAAHLPNSGCAPLTSPPSHRCTAPIHNQA
jgi:hypothetical protein